MANLTEDNSTDPVGNPLSGWRTIKSVGMVLACVITTLVAFIGVPFLTAIRYVALFAVPLIIGVIASWMSPVDGGDSVAGIVDDEIIVPWFAVIFLMLLLGVKNEGVLASELVILAMVFPWIGALKIIIRWIRACVSRQHAR